MKGYGGRDVWLASLHADGPAFRDAAKVPGALGAPVPSCPEWTVLDLIHHLGTTYEWVATHVTRGETTPPDPAPDPAERTLPEGESALGWWDEQYSLVIAALEAVDSRLPAWNWAPQAKQAAFWQRRMANETAVHRWDAQMAVGLPEPIDAALAVDGVAEVLDTWLPAGVRLGPRDRGGIAHLRATDAAAEWFVRLRPEGFALLDTGTVLDTSAPHERVIAAGNASDLMLALWGRIGFDVLEVAGDITLLESLRTG